MAMNVRLVQSLMQLQAMRNLYDSNPNPEKAEDTGVFSAILAEMLGQISNLESSPTNDNTLSLGTPFANNVTAKAPTTSTPTYKSQAWRSAIDEAAAKYGVDPKLIKAVIQHESSFNPNAVSASGAIGLMQLMPQTARSLGVSDPFDPKQNIEGGTKYLKQLLDEFGHNEALALAAYNAGPANVKKYNGIPPFPETERYVQKVLQTYMS